MKEKGVDVQVVSMPSWDRFEAQDEAYKNEVLPKEVTARVGLEMAASFGWDRYVGFEGKTLTIDRFGASANGDLLIEKFGFTVDNVVKLVEEVTK